jgi:hypothetical protein
MSYRIPASRAERLRRYGDSKHGLRVSGRFRYIGYWCFLLPETEEQEFCVRVLSGSGGDEET